MRYIFYADVYFIQNFMIKVAVLYLTLYSNKMYFKISRVKGILKLCLISAVGTVVEMIGLIYGGSYSFFVICVHFLEVPLMVKWAVGKEKRHILRLVLSGYFYMMLINAVLEVLWNQFGENGSYIFYLMFACGIVTVGLRIWKNYMRMQKGIYSVELIYRGNRMQAQAFYDSGNQLIDPYTKKGVHIVSEKLSKNICNLDKPVYIPYQALGNEEGVLEVYYIEELILEGEKQKVHIKNCPLGVTKDKLFEGKNYQIILNEEVF